jgi:hypothetical protein
MLDIIISWLSPLLLVNVFFGTINVVKLIYDRNKDKINLIIQIKRDSISLFSIQKPLKDYLLIEVVNKGYNPVVIKEVGIVFSNKNYINIVDMPWIIPNYTEKDMDVMGSIEWVALPGTLNPGSLGILQILFSNLEEAYKNTKEQRELSIKEPGYLQRRNFFTLYEELMKLYNSDTQVLTLTPYTLTVTGERFIGKKTSIQLGNLNIVMQTTSQNQRENIFSIKVKNYLGTKVDTNY